MTKKKAILALLLLVPVPSIGTFSGMIWLPNTLLGTVIFALSKIWIFAFPVVWYKLIEKGKFSISPAKKGGWGVGFLSGFFISISIFLVFYLFSDQLIDKAFFIKKMNDIGLSNPLIYWGAAAYWILINSVLEEYVWRWFIVKETEALFSPLLATVFSALFFTLHHIIALQTYFSWFAVALCSVGIFIGGFIWSLIYIKYRSIWPAYISHAIVDLCVFAIGAVLIFG